MFERRDLPFPHWVDDTFLTADEARLAASEFPPPSDPRWHTFNGTHENHKSQHPGGFGPITCALLDRLISFAGHIEELTGIRPLAADLLGGGCHQTADGGHLDVHVDYNTHPRTGWRRAVNLLVYLNTVTGGDLELWDGHVRATIPPAPGRAVLFPTDDRSWHGHPIPVGEGPRRSLAVYYFTPDQIGRPHSTEWLHAQTGS